MTKYYRLDEHNNPVECDYSKWLSMLASLDRSLKTTTIGRYTVSTVFIGVNPPLLFETAIIDDWNKEETVIHNRYATWEEAEAGHKKAVEYVGSELVSF